MKYASSFAARRYQLVGVAILLAAILGWTATDQAAAEPKLRTTHSSQNRDGYSVVFRQDDKQPPPKQREEEEDPGAKATPKRKIRFEDEDPKTSPTRPGVAASGDFASLAREAKVADVKKLYRKLVVPYDVITLYRPNDNTYARRAVPVEQFYSGKRSKPSEALQVTYLDDENKPAKPETVKPSVIKSIQPYEYAALEELDHFLKDRKNTGYDDLLVSEQIVSGVISFHAGAMAKGQRKGKDWEAVDSRLRSRLIEVLVNQLSALTEGQDWNGAFAVATRLTESFPGESDQVRIAPVILDLLKLALAAKKAPSINSDQMRDIHLRLRTLTEQYPNNPEIQRLRNSLKEQAEKLLDDAKKLSKSSNKENLAQAETLLRQAAEIWPTLPGLEPLQRELRQFYPILRVGVRQFPKYMSPQSAVTDSELQTLDMLFESLVKFSPDSSGIGRYRPALAEGRPLVVELGRQFQLPPNAVWADGGKLDIASVRANFQALKRGDGPDQSLAWEGLFADKEVTGNGDGYRVNVNLSKGYLEPLALMNMKLVPPSALLAKNAEAFALKPIGSGPFVYSGNGTEQDRSYVQFSTNVHYGSRGSKIGMPNFQEVRFFQYSNALDERDKGFLNILLDVSADEADKLNKDMLGKDKKLTVNLPNKNVPNRRVYFLAVNHRHTPLDDPNMRYALSLAINREQLLDNYFRGSLKNKVHKAINSPYPVHSWACDPKLHNSLNENSCDPFNVFTAQTAFDKVKKPGRGDIELSLKYPEGDTALTAAMTELAEQIHKVLKVKINLQPRDARDLLHDIEITDFDLAYYHYDFPDDTFWLGPLFAPRKPRQDQANLENLFGYGNQEVLGLLQQSIDTREFAKVQACTQAIHGLLVRDTPVIPLWQLDPLHAFRLNVKAPPIDPHHVFMDIEKWHSR